MPSLHTVRELLGEIIHASFHRSILIHHVLDGFASVYNGSMIPASKGISYLLEGMIGEDAAQVHRDLARKCYVIRSPTANHVSHSQVVVFSDFLLNLLDLNAAERFLLQNIMKKPAYSLDINWFLD